MFIAAVLRRQLMIHIYWTASAGILT